MRRARSPPRALRGQCQLDDVRRTPLPDASEITDRAVESTDPHVIKLANVALVEEERTGDPLYRFAAARAVGAVPAARAVLAA